MTDAVLRSGTASLTAGSNRDQSNADIADDHYHRHVEDVRLMAALGTKAYRFSIAWPRVFPEGSGRPNPKGLDFYHRLLDELAANGIEPFVTLSWDLPQALQDRHGGWMSRDTAKAFADYAAYVAGRLSDRVKHTHHQRMLEARSSRPRPRHRCARPQAVSTRAEPGPAPCRAGARPCGAGHPGTWTFRREGRSRGEHGRLHPRDRYAGQYPRGPNRDARAQRRVSHRDVRGQIQGRFSRPGRQGCPPNIPPRI